ncbi:MAG: trigger factor [Flavobacteriaceae bacterium]|nr:trigger factor [Flavobacteriaceae bacterium]
MNISKTDIDKLNAVVNISIDKKDYEQKVHTILKDYRKKANIPGFRKGHVPFGMIKKQYEKAVIVDEVNKLIQENLDNYIKKEKLELLGNPLPKEKNNSIDWNHGKMQFEFELGLAPKFEIKLDVLKKVTHYQIEPDKKMIDEQINHIQNQYGKIKAKKKIEKGFEINAQFKNEEIDLDTMANFSMKDIKSRKAIKLLNESEVGSNLNLPSKGLFIDNTTAKRVLSLDDENLKKLSKLDLTLEIKEVNERIPAEINQDLFDKLYKPGTVKSEKELKDKIKEGLQAQFKPQSNQKLMNDISETIVEKTKFKLPSDFLKKWIRSSGKEPMSEEAAIDEYNKSEKGIRYQLIEGKIISDNNLKMTFEELKKFTETLIKKQMGQYGQMPEKEKLDGIVSNVLSNKEETKRISNQLMGDKMLKFFIEKAPLKRKKVAFDAFMKQAYN